MKEIKRRIKSVESTKQITKAMQLVASSKLRKAKEKADKARPYFKALYDTMCEIQSENEKFFSEFVARRSDERVTLLIVVAGDRGLAGGFNSNIFKLAQARIDEIKKAGSSEIKVLAVGKKSVEYFSKRDYGFAGSYTNIAENLTSEKAAEIADTLVKPYINGKLDRVEIYYTEYVSPLVQRPVKKSLLPLEISAEKPTYNILTNYEPSAEDVFNDIAPKYISGVIYCAIIDSFAAEQAERRMAMDNATENADEMISDLSLKYNRARQASITQEINEIVGGAAGL